MGDEKCKDCPPAIEVVNLKLDVENHRKDIQAIYGRLNSVEKDTSEFKTEIKNLCKQIESLVTTLRWTAGIVITVGGLLVAIFKK